MSQKRSHEEARSVVCFACFNKAKRSVKITGKLLGIIRDICPKYNQDDECVPNVVCRSCYIKLCKKQLNIVLVDYEKLKIRIKRNESLCSCPICNVARYKPNPRKAKCENMPSVLSIKKCHVGRPTKKDKCMMTSTILKLCSICHTKIQKGNQHLCTLREKVTNTIVLTENCSQQLASQILYKEAEISSSDIISLNKGRGINMKVEIQKGESSKDLPVIRTECLKDIQLDCNLPVNTMKKITQHLRKVDRKIIEPKAINNLKNLSFSLDNFFSCITLPEIDVGKHIKAPVPFVYCSNLTAFFTHLFNERQISEGFHLKLGIDSGGGSLKICLSVCIYENILGKHENQKTTGIKKLIIIGMAPKMIESYENVKTIFEILEINSVCGVGPYTFAADLKLIMMLLGLQSSSSCHPCPWCDTDSRNLETRGELRTINLISQYSNSWRLETGGDMSKAKYYKNCVNIPLITGDGDLPVIHYIPPPELHLMMGVVQKLFDCIKKVYPDIAEKWLKISGIQLDHYQRFNGNNARKLLKNVELLRKLDAENKYIEVFIAFNKVVTSCFGQKLDMNYKISIMEFSQKIKEVKINFTPKIHTVVHHIVDFTNITQRALGFYSEQASEQVHYSYKLFARNFNLNPQSTNFQKNLLRSVSSYNSKHI